MTTVRVTGLRELVRDLEKMGIAISDLKNVFSSIANEGAQLAARFAPHRTGALARSIRGNKAKNKAVITAGRGRTNLYAGVINFGYPKRNIEAQLYMQRASLELAPSIEPKLSSAINELLRERDL